MGFLQNRWAIANGLGASHMYRVAIGAVQKVHPGTQANLAVFAAAALVIQVDLHCPNIGWRPSSGVVANVLGKVEVGIVQVFVGFLDESHLVLVVDSIGFQVMIPETPIAVSVLVPPVLKLGSRRGTAKSPYGRSF